MPSVLIKRGTRAQINTAAGSSGLKEGELYLDTNNGALLAGLSASAYQSQLGVKGAIASGKFGLAKYSPSDQGYLSATVAIAANFQYCYPFLVLSDKTVDGVAIVLAGNSAGNKMRCALYPINANGSVGSVLIDSGDFSTAGGSLLVNTISDTVVPSGLYLAQFCTSVSLSVRALNQPSGLSYGTDASLLSVTYAAVALAGGWTGLPALPGSSGNTFATTFGNTLPGFALRNK